MRLSSVLALLALLLATPAGLAAQQTGGSYGGDRFGAPEATSGGGSSGGSSSAPGGWSGSGDMDGFGLVALIAFVAVGLVVVWARDLLSSLWVLARGRDKTCTSCDFIGRARWGRCPKCRGDMVDPF
ncbi:MAG: hypothetical protein VYE22_20735 [Myxococcota bacterium]|nr:hypothetical protein [Myxococcota bacterium]